MSKPRPKRFIRYAVFASLVLLVGAGLWLYLTRNSIPELFEELPVAEAPKTFPEAQFSKRFRWVKLNPEAFDRAFEVGGKLKLNFFADRKHLTTIVGKQVHGQFNSTSAALLDDNPETMAIFSRGKDSFYAVFTLSDMRQVVVSHAGGRAYSVAEIDPASVGRCGPPPDARSKKESKKAPTRTSDAGPVQPAEPSSAIEEIQKQLTPDQRALLGRILSSPEAGAKLGRALEAPAKSAERTPTSVTLTASPIAADLLMRGHREVAGTEVATPFLAQLAGYSLYGRTGQAAKMNPGAAAQVLYPRLGATEYIDVLFLYTAAAQATAGNAASVYARVTALVAQVNAIFARSRIPMEIRAVNDPAQFAADRYLARSRYWEGSAATTLPEDYNPAGGLSSGIINVTDLNPAFLAIPRSTMDNLAFNNRTTHIPEGINGIYTGAMMKPGWDEIISYGEEATGAPQSRPLGSGTFYLNNDQQILAENSPEAWFGRYAPKIVNFDSGGNLSFSLDWLLNVPAADPAAAANSWGDRTNLRSRSNGFLYGDQYWGLNTPWINHIHTNSWNDLFNLTASLYSNAGASGTPIPGYTWNLVPNTAAQVMPLTAGVQLTNPDPVGIVPRAPVRVFASNPAGPVAETQWQFVGGMPNVTNFLTTANFLIGPAENTPNNVIPSGLPPSFDVFTISTNSHPYRTVYAGDGAAPASIVTDANQEYWNSDIFVGPTFDTRFYKQNVRGIPTVGYPLAIQNFQLNAGVPDDTWAFVGALRAPLRRLTGGQLGLSNLDAWGADAYPYAAFTEVGRNGGVWGERIHNADAIYTRNYLTGYSYTVNPGNVFVSRASHGLIPGQEIFITNAPAADALFLNGNRRVVTATANWFTFANQGATVGNSGTFETGNPWLTITLQAPPTDGLLPLQSGDVVRICSATAPFITDRVISGGLLNTTGALYEVERINDTSFRVLNPTPSSNTPGTIPIGTDPTLVLHRTTDFNTPTLAAATAGNTLAADTPSASGVFRLQFLDNPATTGQYSGAVGLRMDTLNALGADTSARYPRLHTETLIDEKPDVICLLDTSSGAVVNITGLSYQFERRYRTYNAVTNQNYISAAGHGLHQYPSDGLCQSNVIACATMWRDNRFACAVDLVQASLNYSLAHEFGHILGCSHGYGDLGLMPDDDTVVFSATFNAAATSAPTSPDTFNSMGVHILGDDGNYYHSIMAYQRTASSLRIPYFSSPNLYFRGRQLNRSSDVLTSGGASASNCDNVQCISIIGGVVSNYRNANGTGRSASTYVVGSIPGSGVLPRTNQPLPDLSKFGSSPVGFGMSAPKGSTGTGSVPDASKAGSTATGAGKKAASTTATPTTATQPAAATVAGKNGTTAGVMTPAGAAVKTAAGSASSLAAKPVAVSRPPNDDIARAIMIQGANRTVRGENKGATPEQWEAPYTTAFQGKSVWWYWDAPAEGRRTIKTEGSNFDTVLLVFMYVNGKFLPVGLNDNAGNGISWSQMSVPLRKGTRYFIGVDGAGGAEGQVVVNVEQAAVAASPAKATSVAPKATKQKVRNLAPSPAK